jgi:outer membrane protein assembly factor BamD
MPLSVLLRITALLSVLGLAACATTDNAKPKSPETMVKEADALVAKGRHDEAIAQWKKVKDSYRSPEVTAMAELKIADAYYAKESWIEAAAAYEDFRKLHPQNDKAPYALYRMALSHYNQIEKIDTDQTPVKNAASALEMFLKFYPQSEYAKDADFKLAMCRLKMARYELYVGRFYYRTDKYVSAVGRFEGILKNYSDYPVIDETLYYLGSSYLQIGEIAKGKDALNRLVKEFPASKYAEKARKLLASS